MKRIIFLALISALFASCSSEPHYTVKGKIEGSDSIKFYLQKRESGKFISIDSAISEKGSIKFVGGVVAYPQLIYMVAGETRNRTSFYLENSDINITGTLDSLFIAKVTGSKTQDEYTAFIESNKPLSAIYQQTYIEYMSAKQAGDNAKVALMETKADSIQGEMTKLQKDFVKNNPTSYVSPSILISLSYEMEPDEIESMISGLDTALVALPQIQTLKEKVSVMKAVAIGQKAPDFTMNDVNGNPIALSSKFGSKLLLVDFWAAWCMPCRQENPNIVNVYNEFNKKGFDVYGVSLDQSKEEWIKAIEDDKLTWTHVLDEPNGNNSAAKLYAVSAIPSNFLLDETGTILGRNLRGEDLYNKVNEILGAKK